MASIKEALKKLSDRSIRHIVSISGGKDSTALAIYMNKQYRQIQVEYVFCDTDNELPETYEYLNRLEALLGKRVQRLNALEPNGILRKNRNAFDIFLNELYGGYLPSPRARWCTNILKIQPFEKYIGNDRAFSYIGIRADENREGYKARKPPVISKQPNIIPVYPFKDDGIGLTEVKQILEESGLGLPDYYKWRSRSGCYFCFYQQIGEWQRLKEHHPDLFEKAQQYEKLEGTKKFTWTEGRSLEEIANLSRKEPLPINEDEGCAVCHL